METGSFINWALSNTPAIPKVGDPATICGWTDRHGATVIKVSASGKTITIQEDTATRVDGNGMSECQTWAHTPNPQGRVYVARLTARGWRSKGGTIISLGHRSTYFDFSF